MLGAKMIWTTVNKYLQITKISHAVMFMLICGQPPHYMMI